MYDTEQMEQTEQLEKDQKARSWVVAAFAFSIFVFIILIIRGYHPVNPERVDFVDLKGWIKVNIDHHNREAFFDVTISNQESVRKLVETERLMYTENAKNRRCVKQSSIWRINLIYHMKDGSEITRKYDGQRECYALYESIYALPEVWAYIQAHPDLPE